MDNESAPNPERSKQIIADIGELMNEIDGDNEKVLAKHLRLARLLNALKACTPHRQFGACCKDLFGKKSASWRARLMKAGKFVDSEKYGIALEWWRSIGGEEPLTIDQIHKFRLGWEDAQRRDEQLPEDVLPSKRKRKDV